jgi:dTDP-4-dehydrorhamnose 3,5-epimerase
MRKDSPSFCKWISATLSESNRRMLYVPRGFAHGFLATGDTVEVEYSVDNVYRPDHEGGIIWNDPDVAIKWPMENPILSDKDKAWPRLSQLKPG